MNDQCTSRELSPDEMVDFLRTKNELFNRLFTMTNTPQNMTVEEELEAQNIFNESFPNYHTKNFQIFYNLYLNEKVRQEMGLGLEPTEANETCPKMAYDATKRGFIKMPRVSNYGRGKREKFNLGEFLRTKRENGDYFQISVGDRDMVEDLLEELNEDRIRNDQKADVALNRMVEMAAILNGNCNYKILELHPERRVQ